MTVRLQLKTVALRDDGCYSVALWEGRPIAVALERTFDDIRPIVPNGTFRCVRGRHRLEGGQPFDTFEITGVAGHSGLLFHKGNVETDSKGCVLVAESFFVLNGKTAIGDSKHGFEELMQLAAGLDEFDLEVTGR